MGCNLPVNKVFVPAAHKPPPPFNCANVQHICRFILRTATYIQKGSCPARKIAYMYMVKLVIHENELVHEWIVVNMFRTGFNYLLVSLGAVL